MEKIKEYVRKHWFIAIIVLACIIKQLLVCALPIYVRDNCGVDQWKLLTDAENIMAHSYLVPYDTNTLFKRAITFPLFLAALRYLGISYLSGYTLFYTFACLISLLAISKFTKNKVVLCISFILLLFSPCTYDGIIQLVYNLGLTVPLTLLMISSLIIAYKVRFQNFRVMCAWIFFAGINAAFIWLNREDSMWILPLLGIYAIVMWVSVFRNNKKISERLKRIIVAICPIIIVVIGNLCLCMVNYKGYGVFVSLDNTSTNFEKAYNSILKVQQNVYPKNCAITREMLQRIYKISPSMAELEPFIEAYYDANEGMVLVGEDPNDGEIEDGWMNFVLRGAAASRGYYESAIKADEFWGRVSDEIETAIAQGKIESRSTFFFGTTLHHPWRRNDHYLRKWLVAAKDILKTDVLHENEQAEVRYNEYDGEVAERYEAMTQNYSISKPSCSLKGLGWLFIENIDRQYSIRIVDSKENVLQNLLWEESDDISNGYGNIASNISTCRFVIDCINNIGNEFFLEVLDSDNIVVYRTEINKETNVEDVTSETIEIDGKFYKLNYAYDDIDLTDGIEDIEKTYAEQKVENANRIAKLYRIFSPVLFVLSLLVYIYNTISLLKTIKTKEYRYLDEWIFQSAILGCVVVLLAALSYIKAFMWNSTWYSHTITWLLEYFYVISIVSVFTILKDFRERKNEKRREA